ncbi:MAG: hypothetical protein J0I34_25835 [Pseudonocardia sp.]|uniref:hypothetical protein n=1 Tax=unclassified Pseudonocardia TaxID=2619320 RepID=UPI00086ED905|nr:MULTISPECIES: hypothetical protein [unclassified Pseudonocardia]MBN9112194.1 hypothetical protein [Pseudonocardia sp.]ODU30132.1 MAG: hypothetical protein ABS80_00570 [Pseudonocardia sp. SCN 72-51]ODV03056.1 MAG: hypothetical protein ABT15_23795 [Pseudonocardia sp. SCN 73-27]
MDHHSIAADELFLGLDGQGESVWSLSRPLPGEPNRYDIQTLGLTALWPGDPAPDGPGMRYRRTARPAQGRLSENRTVGLMLTLLDAKDRDDAAGVQSLRDWADFVHLPALAVSGTPGLTLISPYRVVGDGPLFLHLLEFDVDPDQGAKEMTRRVSQQLDKPEIARFLDHPQKDRAFGATFVLKSD